MVSTALNEKLAGLELGEVKADIRPDCSMTSARKASQGRQHGRHRGCDGLAYGDEAWEP
jgi:hypothetical protein